MLSGDVHLVEIIQKQFDTSILIGLPTIQMLGCGQIREDETIVELTEMGFIDADNEVSLVSQLGNHILELNTLKEADLCNSPYLHDRIFVKPRNGEDGRQRNEKQGTSYRSLRQHRVKEYP